MKSWNATLGLWVFTGALLATPATWAVEALSTEELVSHCAKYHDESASEDRTFCVRYIQGFIDGAVATDEQVANNVTREFGQGESYSARAARTRIGPLLARYGPTVYAEYCLGDPVPLEEVAERVVNDLTDEAVVTKYPRARDAVYATLRSHYPCRIVD
ncbi:MAG: Rap1a/Tai family immunity protein [Lysobacterales bacterium]